MSTSNAKKTDTRLAPTLPPWAMAELVELSEAMGVPPSTLAGRLIEQMVLSRDFVEMKARVMGGADQPKP